MATFRVIGPWKFEGYSPGETFEGELHPEAEARAIAHKAIELIDSTPLSLDPERVLPPAVADPETEVL